MNDDTLMPSLLDREIDDRKADAFGHAHFADAVRSLVESPANVPPYSVGLLGEWGTGKSSIKSLYLADLGNDRTKNGHSALRKDRIFTITFNAWRYGGENIKRALLRHVYVALGGDETRIADRLFHQVQRDEAEAKTPKQIWEEVYDKWPWALLQFALWLVVAIAGVWVVAAAFGIGDQKTLAWLVAGFLFFGGVLAKGFLDAKRFVVSRYLTIKRVELPSASAEQYEEFLVSQLRKFKWGESLGGVGKPCERIVIFVDDLDRLSAEEMISGLDAVRTFMEIPSGQLPAGLGIVFVISCDEDRIADALANKRRQATELPAAVLTRNDARRYLDRIFQFRLEIPPFPKQDMREFARARLAGIKGLSEGLGAAGSSVEELVSRTVHVGVQSPRKALQILNAFLQSWWVASQRERDGAGTHRRGGLQEGAVTKWPVALGVLSVLRVDWPDFYGDLGRDPELIGRFTDVFLRSRPLSGMPEATQALLRKYGSEKDDAIELHADWRPLRQYLASTIGVPWPPSLQPLLLLSQDPVTRGLGDKARRVFDSFVSGDAAGVLADLGRDADGKPLSPDEVRLLRDIYEDLQADTADRRDHAAAVLAALADRLPEREAPLAMVPLARALTESPALRWRIGVERIGKILEHTPPADRRAVAGKLATDLLKIDDDTEFRLESGEPPSLDEAAGLVTAAAGLCLDVRSNDGPDASWDRSLLDWLLVRHVSVGGNSQELPFSALESWMCDHEAHLLDALGERYAAAVVERLAAGDEDGLDPTAVVRRMGEVFRHLWDAGEESRALLWPLLERYASVRMGDAVALSWQVFGAHADAPDADTYARYVAALSARLRKDMSGGEAWALAWNDGAAALLRILDGREADLDSAACESLATLADSWSTDEATAGFAVSLLDRLFRTETAESEQVVMGWVSRVLSDLPEPCLEWIGQHYADRLTSEARSQLASQLNVVAQPPSATPDVAARYASLMGRIPEEELSKPPMSSHLQTVYAALDQHHGDLEYLERIFPTATKTLAHAPANSVGPLLHGLFAHTRNAPAVHGFLHGEMVGKWPLASPELSPYGPPDVFAWAREVVRGSSVSPATPRLLASMRSMIEGGVVPRDLGSHLAEAALLAWPHHPDAALAALASGNHLPSVESIVGLATQVDPDDVARVEQLDRLWQHCGPLLNQAQRIEGARRILLQPARGGSDRPDFVLRSWIAAESGSRALVLKALMQDPELNDTQRRRVWLQIASIASELGGEYLMDIVRHELSNGSSPETARAILDASAHVTAQYPTTEGKRKLGTALLEAFVAAPSLEVKNGLGQWLKALGNAAILGGLAKLNPSEEDVELLRSLFPGSRHLSKWNG